MFRHVRYRVWLYIWSKRRTAEGHPEISVHRRYEYNIKFVDLYWSVTDKETGLKKSYYDRMSFHNIIHRVKREERHILQDFFSPKKQ